MAEFNVVSSAELYDFVYSIYTNNYIMKKINSDICYNCTNADLTTNKKEKNVNDTTKSTCAQNFNELGLYSCNQDLSYEKELYNKSTSEKFSIIHTIKNRGNKHYSNGNYFAAEKDYTLCVLYINYTFPNSEREKAIYNELASNSYSNLAQAKFKTNQYNDAIVNSRIALKYKQNNEKCILRIFKSYVELNQLDKAKSYILETKDNLNYDCSQLLKNIEITAKLNANNENNFMRKAARYFA